MPARRSIFRGFHLQAAVQLGRWSVKLGSWRALQRISDRLPLSFSCLALDPVKDGVLDQGDPPVPAIDVDQGCLACGHATRQAQMRADMVLCDTCFSAYVIGSVVPSS